MIRAFLSFTILLLTIIVVGCKSQRIDAPESVVIDGKVIYGTDGSPLRQTIIKRRVSDGKTFLTDTLGNFHIEGQTGNRKHDIGSDSPKCYSTADGMTMRIVSSEPIKSPIDSLIVEFTNSREIDLTTGEWYRIDIQSAKGNWEQAPYSAKYIGLMAKGTGVCFNDIGYVVPPNGTFNMIVKPWIYDLSDKSATYRLVKTFHYPPYPIQKSDTAYVEFQII